MSTHIKFRGALYRKAEDSVYEGLSWESLQGARTVVSRQNIGGQDKWLVQTEGRSNFDVYSKEDVLFERKRDTANLRFREKEEEQRKTEEEEEKRLSYTYGFYDQMTPMTAARAKKILEANKLFNGILLRRKDAVERMVKEGYTIELDRKGKRRLTSPTGSFLIEKDITKVAMDYAEHLINNNIMPT